MGDKRSRPRTAHGAPSPDSLSQGEQFKAREISLSLTHRCPHLTLTDSNRSKWAALSTAMSVLTALGADHNICCGTLLGWYRSCTLFDSDIDLEVSLAWWRQPRNSDILKSSLLAAGAYRGLSFGSWLQPGYEEAWFFDGVKVDFFARSKVDLRVLRYIWPQNLPAKGPFYATGLTVRTSRSQYRKTFACISPVATFVRAFWSTVPIFVPEPVEPYLVAAYGKHWQRPLQSSEHRWDITPFLSGRCSKAMILCPHEMQNGTAKCVQGTDREAAAARPGRARRPSRGEGRG